MGSDTRKLSLEQHGAQPRLLAVSFGGSCLGVETGMWRLLSTGLVADHPAWAGSLDAAPHHSLERGTYFVDRPHRCGDPDAHSQHWY